ncbi:NADPH-dependent F420 reductase [Streptomyces sp. 11-1-2]|uniref:NADPH-dependent F420 reductase n=1 Tax=unclassified Streptomyces TaxID=2593676 RepID=UPI000B8D3D9F|nr:NADPH-dependent F420 reductase [Streptomyces sp. 11-1-2]ASR00560.1 NADPH-dependent F420 reductase [Streptomyces sp. 11-1-2]
MASITVGVIGGTGHQGRGLAYRWANAGLSVAIGSRDVARAAAAANELRAESGSGTVIGLDNATCAEISDVVLIAVPWAAHDETLETLRPELAGKIVIDCVNPLGFDRNGPYAVDVPGVAVRAADLLPESRVVAAFHHVSAVLLSDPKVSSMDLDVLVLGDDPNANDMVCRLADAIPGVRGIHGGRLRNAAQVEALTASLIAINHRYKIHAGLRITDSHN